MPYGNLLKFAQGSTSPIVKKIISENAGKFAKPLARFLTILITLFIPSDILVSFIFTNGSMVLVSSIFELSHLLYFKAIEKNQFSSFAWFAEN
jgi:hypothetical protein